MMFNSAHSGSDSVKREPSTPTLKEGLVSLLGGERGDSLSGRCRGVPASMRVPVVKV